MFGDRFGGCAIQQGEIKMDGKGIKIKFEADESPIRSALVRVEKSVKSISKELKEVDKLLELDPDNITLLTQKNEQLSEAITRTTKNLQSMEDANEEVTKGYQKWQENRAAIEKTGEAITKTTNELNDAKAALQAMVDAGGKDIELTEEYKSAAATVDKLTKSLEELNKEQEKNRAADSQAIPEDVYRKYIRDVESLRINLNQLEQQQTEVTSAIQAGGLAAQRAAEEEQRSAAAEAERTRAAEAAARAAEEAARAAEKQARADEERKKAVEKAAAAEKKAKQAANDYKDALNKLENAADKVKSDISGMATAVVAGTAAIGGAVAAGTAAVTKVGMGFTKSMSNVQALSGATGAELEALKNAASEAGANTSKTASEAADALGYMALAGWDTNQMLEGLMPVLRASEAGAMDLATCSDLVTDSMSSMGIAVEDLQHYLDVCSKTQSSANTSMEQLLQAYVGCGGMLKNLNVPMEESAALLGTLANRGIKGAEAGTSLNAILVNLIGANRNAASAMSEMGISAFDASGRFIGLEETLKLVKSKLDEYGNDTEKISKIEAKLGGKTQLDTLMALLSGVSEEYDTLNGKINDCDGALEATAKTMQDNLTGDITSLQSALEGVENTIFDSLEEPFRSAAQNATKEMRDLNIACSSGEMSESLKKIATAVGELLSKAAEFAADEAFPTLINWLEWIVDHSDFVISAISCMGTAWAAWKVGQVVKDVIALVVSTKAAIAAHTANAAAQAGVAATATAAAAGEGALATATGTATVAQQGLNAAMLANPIILAVAAVAALAVGLTTLAIKADKVGQRMRETKEDIEELNESVKSGTEQTQESINASEAEIAVIKAKADEYETLRTQQNRTEAQEARLRDLAEELQQYMPENVSLIDEETGAYNSLAGSIDDVVASMERKAKVQAYESELTKLYEQQIEAKKLLDEINKDPIRWQDPNSIGKANDFWDWYHNQEDAEAALENINSRIEELGGEIQESYAAFSEAPDYDLGGTPNYKSTAQMAAEEYGRNYTETMREQTELAKMGVKQSYDDLMASLEDLDNDLATHDVDDNTYWAKRKELLEDSRYEEDAEWWKLYDETIEHYDTLAETEKKAQEDAAKEQQEALEKSIEDQINAVKERQETENDYTKEMMFNDMEAIISGLDKESDVYKKYNSEILKGRKELADQSTKTVTEGLKAEVTEVENSIKGLVSEYQNSLKQITSDRDSYFNKLFDTSSFTSRSKQTDKNGKEADVFSLSDPEEAYKKLVAYENEMEKLKAKGVSENVLSWIETLDTATA